MTSPSAKFQLAQAAVLDALIGIAPRDAPGYLLDVREQLQAQRDHTFVATMRPDGGATTALLPPLAIASWSDAIPFGRVAG